MISLPNAAATDPTATASKVSHLIDNDETLAAEMKKSRAING
jgi:hypothetical protein